MQKSEMTASVSCISREDFLRQAEKIQERVLQELRALHGEPPCIHAVEIRTVQSWSVAKREETRTALRAALARAESILEEARKERLALWERSEATGADLEMPFFIPLKQIREDLTAYEDILNYVKSASRARV